MSVDLDNLPNPRDAYNHVFSEIHATTFFNKLASAGISPSTDQEVEDLLKLAGTLRPYAAQAAEKTASASRFGGALNDLSQLTGATQATNQLQSQMAIKQAAAAVLQDPAIYQSMLSLHLHDTALNQG